MRILIVDIDSLRPDHLGCYGYDRDTSPVIDDIANRGVRFDNCYASDTPCLPSRTSLVTCRFAARHGAVTHWGNGQWYEEPGTNGEPDTDRTMAPTYLSGEGITTATISIFSRRHRAYHWDGAFQESVQPTGSLGFYDESHETNAALRWLDANAAADDWLLHVNYWDVHHPYVGVDEHVDEVRESGPPAPWPDEAALDQQQGMTGMHCADLWTGPRHYDSYEVEDNRFDRGDWSMPMRYRTREDVEQLVDGYDGGVRKVDAQVAHLLEKLEEEGVREETAIVITGDHGEALGEHGIYAEHSLAHPACQNVPLIVDWPGVTDDAAGTAVEEHVYQFDLMATICDLAGLDRPARWDAEAFTPALRGEGFEGREALVCGHGIYIYSRAVYRDDWVYIRLLHPGVFSVPGLYNDPDLPNRGLELLHDLSEDPHMTENLIGERPEVAAELRGHVDEWNASVIATEDCTGTDPLVEMAATDGPFFYVTPDELIEFYEREGRSQAQTDAVDRSRDFPARL
jgi:arylsulfatase A-like enzyme